MTRDRARKRPNEHSTDATGVPLIARRAQQPSPLAEVMTSHPIFGIGVFDAHRKPRHQRGDELAQKRERTRRSGT